MFDTELLNTETITGSYSNDLNIVILHRLILKRMEIQEIKNQEQIKMRLEYLESNLNLLRERKKEWDLLYPNKPIVLPIKDHEEEINSLKGQLHDSKRKKFTLEVKHLLDSYTKLPPISIQYDFATNKEIIQGMDNNLERIRIIEEYLSHARKYDNISISGNFVLDVSICGECGTSRKEYEDACPQCGFIYGILGYPVTISGSTSSYSDRSNFLKVLQRFQGLQKNTIKEDLFLTLDKYFESIGFPSREEIKKRPLDKYGYREGTSKGMIINALGSTGYNKYYNDINLICHMYWGYTLPDISYLIPLIMEDYDTIQPIIIELKKNILKSSINTQYRLFRQLYQRGYPCTPYDFKIVRTEKIINIYEWIWENVCVRMGWVFKPICEMW